MLSRVPGTPPGYPTHRARPRPRVSPFVRASLSLMFSRRGPRIRLGAGTEKEAEDQKGPSSAVV